MDRNNNWFWDKISKIVYKIFDNERLLQSEFRFGKVESVIDYKQIRAYIDGGTEAILCRCNPNITFNVGDSILIIYINRNSNNRYAIARIEY
ncbi:MAG: hypothetical protein K0S80_2919 [Neobacillus sp.]|nr:hypothetical protein [Neobacillus sp.]